MLESKRPRIAEHARSNFGLSSYVNAQGKRQPMYRMTVNGLPAPAILAVVVGARLKIQPSMFCDEGGLAVAIEQLELDGLKTEATKSRRTVKPVLARPLSRTRRADVSLCNA